MAAKKSRARQFGGGGIDIGAILNATQGGADVENVPNIKPSDIIADKPYDWSEKNIPTSRIKTKKLTEQDMSDIASRNLFRGKGKIGEELATKGNIENILAEEQAKRGLRTKESEIPIEAARRTTLDPLDLAKTTKEHIIALLTSQGIQPTEENIKKHLDLTSNIALSRTAEESYRDIDKARLEREGLSKNLEIATKNRPLDVDTASKAAQYGNIAAQQALTEQPEEPAKREEERLRKRIIEMSPGSSVFDIISPKKPMISAPTPDMYEKAGIPRPSITPKIGQFGAPALGNVGTEGSISPDPIDPDNFNIIIVGGKKIRVRK